MREYYPLLVVCAIVGIFTTVFIMAFALMKNKKEAIGFDRHMKDSELIKRIGRYAKPYWKSYIIVLLLMILAVAYEVISPTLVGEIEELVKTRDFELSELGIKVILFSSILILSLTALYLEAVILQKVGQKILSHIREDLFTHIESLSHNQLNHIPVGKLVTRETNDTNALSMLFTKILVNLSKSIFMIIGVSAAMFLLNYFLTLLVLAFVPFIVLFTFIFRKFSRRAYRKVKDATTDINTFLSENLSGIKITQIFNNEGKKLREFEKKNRTLYKAMFSEVYVYSIFRPVIYMLYISSVLLLFYFSAKGYIEDFEFMGQKITSGTLVSFYIYTQTFYNPIQSLAETFNWLQSAFASAEKIFTIMDMKPEIEDEEDAIEVEKIQGEIEFKHVWFAYEEENWILKDVSFHINPGETVAFVGPTGAGKTTILSLVCRNYDIQKGEIRIDGIPVRRYKKANLRKHFGQMLQDVFLFSGTVKSNIVLREEGFTDAEIREACQYVNADRFIEKLPLKYEEEVRERGNNFSAGQRQLLSFARTVIHKPDVMILDEATANIDTETEQLIQNSLEKMMNIGTMLIVAHRLSTIQHADKIIVLKKGEIVEMGNHQQLLAAKGAYYELYTLQYEERKVN